jgi:hypothetical protein
MSDDKPERTCREMLGIDCVLPVNHDGPHVRKHLHDLATDAVDDEERA